MANAKRNLLNPELEELRNSIPKPIDNDKLLSELLPKLSSIHAKFLFCEPIGDKLLKQLCLCLCATKNSLCYSGMKELCSELRLDPLLQQSLENYNINNQDPMYNIFFAYIQQDEATIRNIYLALHHIKRFDIIAQTKDLVLDFCQNVNQICTTEREENALLNLPTPPHILRNFDKINNHTIIIRRKIKETLLNSDPPPTRKTATGQKQKYDKVVMLTYCSGDENIAKQIAEQLRIPKNNQQIGVVILQEHSSKVNADAEIFISCCFSQAHFILPILSLNYLNTVSGVQQNNNCTFLNVDAYYVKYIYNLMLYNYLKNGCQNRKIRCIIPDDQCNEVLSHYFASNPEFRVWFKLSQIEDLANKILSSNM